MDTLETLRVFVRVAYRNGFAAAARDLRLSPATVTKQVAALEERLGIRLLERTTRKVSLTEAGRVYYDRSLEVLHALADADASVTELTRTPSGLLRVAAPVELGQSYLAALLAPFVLAHPRIVLDVRLSNRAPDLVEEGFDVSIRVVRPDDVFPHVSRALAVSRLGFWATPGYLKAHPKIRKPEDLEAHRHLVFTEPVVRDTIVAEKGAIVKRVTITPAMLSNNAEVLRVAMLEGVGVMLAPTFITQADAAARRILPILPDWSLGELRFMALYPQRRFLSSKVRAFLEALQAAYGDGARDPWAG